jgi:CBS domain-containing protein
MQASELMMTDFPVLQSADEVQKAVDIFLDSSIGHIPIVDMEGNLEGIFPTDMVIHGANRDQPLSDFRDDWMQAFVYPEQHGLIVFEVLARLELSAVPVVSEQRVYQGTISTHDLLTRLSSFYSFREPGGIILLSVGTHDFNLGEIARIVESNNAKILMLYMDMDEAAEFMKVTIKVSTTDLSHIIPTFERFKYTVDYFFPNVLERDELKERYDMVMKLFDL